MAMLLRFAPFRGELQVPSSPMECQWRETAQNEKTREGQRVWATSDSTLLHGQPNTVGLCRQQFKVGSKLLLYREYPPTVRSLPKAGASVVQNLQAHSSPKTSVFQNQRAAQQAITPADVNFTPILQGQSRSRTVKIVKGLVGLISSGKYAIIRQL